MNPRRLLALAAAHALPKDGDPRNFWLGAVGIRADGVLVKARNGSLKPTSPAVPGKHREPSIHAEVRLCRKLDLGAEAFVARVSRETGQWALAKPCSGCLSCLLAKGVKRIYYTISPNEYGVIHV